MFNRFLSRATANHATHALSVTTAVSVTSMFTAGRPSASGMFCVQCDERAITTTTACPIPIIRVDVNKRMSDLVKYNGTIHYVTVPGSTHTPIQQQVSECLADLSSTLSKNGSDKDRVLSVTVYLTDLKDFAGMNEVWDGFWNEGHAPVRCTIGGIQLAKEGWKVEMVCVAAEGKK